MMSDTPTPTPAPKPDEAKEAKKATTASRKKTEPDPYKDYADAEAFPCVLTLATGEMVGSPSVQSTEHYSPKLDCNVPVVGVLAR
jgi:hypothetical protein